MLSNLYLMSTRNSSQQRLLATAAVIIILLLGINAFLLYNKYSQDKVLAEQTSELAEADKLKIELEKQYHEALSELEEMKSSNEELNDIIDRQKLELKLHKDRIDKLLKEGHDLGRARAEINNLSAQVSQYLAQIQELKQDKAALTEERDLLTERSKMLEENLDSARLRNQQLSVDVESLASEKQQISAERNQLAQTVTQASVIKVSNIIVTGLKERSSGKTVKKKYAKNVDQLRVCFSTTKNDIVPHGAEQFYVRIINPVGETMAIEDLGSGIFTSRETGEEIRYTFLKEHTYDKVAKELCVNWSPGPSLILKGKYIVEIYNKGYLSGKGEFELK